MKNPPFGGWSFVRLVSLALLVFGAVLRLHAQAPAAPAEDPDFAEARRLFWSGQYDESEKKFSEYLLLHPKHVPSENFLKMIKQSRIYNPSEVDDTRQRLDAIRVDRLEFKGADWRAVAAYLEGLANPKVDGKAPSNYINFISLVPSGFSTKITLDLRNITLLRAIEYSCRQAGLRHVIDTRAVIIELPQSKK